VAVDQDGAGDVCLVTLGDGVGGQRSVRIERIHVGRTVFGRVAFDAAGLAGQEELERRIAERADPDLILVATVDGIAPDSLEILPDEIERRLAGSFLQLRVIDRSVAELPVGLDLPADTVAGRFILDVASRLEEAETRGDGAAAEQARQVLRLGRRLLLDDPDHVTLA
jgi:hypothetical protein